MNINIRAYQHECIESIFDKIESGATRISVAMTIGLGKLFTSIFLAEEIINRYSEECLLVFWTVEDCEIAKREIKSLGGSEKISCETYSFFLHKENQTCKYCFFYDMPVYARKQISDAIKTKEIVAVSFFSPEQNITERKRAGNFGRAWTSMTHAECTEPVVCVFETKTVLDIRDIRCADGVEASFIKKEISVASDWLAIERGIAERERKEARVRFNRLQAYRKDSERPQDWQTIKNQTAEVKGTEGLLQADERDKRIEQPDTCDKEDQEQISEKDAIIARQSRMISFLVTLCSNIGIPSDTIQKSFEQIQEARESLNDDLESRDEERKETALKSLQDKVAEIVDKISRRIISVDDNTYYKEYLIGELSQEVWDKLDEKSQTFLITAKTVFDSMTKMPDSDSMDYSGVCLLVTKALEVETTKRFLNEYKNFLGEKYTSISQWPYVLRQKIRGQITDEIISDKEFTLGSVVPTVGYWRKCDADGNVVSYCKDRDEKARLDFLDYATEILFKSPDRNSAEKEIEKDYQFIEKVRLDYRNPAAHRNKLTITSAENCFKYVIDVEHKLKEMLVAMKI